MGVTRVYVFIFAHIRHVYINDVALAECVTARLCECGHTVSISMDYDLGDVRDVLVCGSLHTRDKHVFVLSLPITPVARDTRAFLRFPFINITCDTIALSSVHGDVECVSIAFFKLAQFT